MKEHSQSVKVDSVVTRTFLYHSTDRSPNHKYVLVQPKTKETGIVRKIFVDPEEASDWLEETDLSDYHDWCIIPLEFVKSVN